MRIRPFIFLAAGLSATSSGAAAESVTANALLVSAGRPNMAGAEDAILPSDPALAAALTADTHEVIAPVWVSACPSREVMVGVRLLRADTLSGMSAICAKVNRVGKTFAWASEPHPVMGPPPPRPAPLIEQTSTHEMRVSIGQLLPDGSFAVRAESSVFETVTEQVPDPSVPAGPPVVVFADGKAHDVLCPSGQFVSGVRMAPPTEKGVTRLDLSCRRDARDAALVNAMGGTALPKAKKVAKKGGAAAPVIATGYQRVDCRGVTSNPNDGIAASAIFGTIQDGHVQSVGINCADTVDPYSALHSVSAMGKRLASDLALAIGLRRPTEIAAQN